MSSFNNVEKEEVKAVKRIISEEEKEIRSLVRSLPDEIFAVLKNYILDPYDGTDVSGFTEQEKDDEIQAAKLHREWKRARDDAEAARERENAAERAQSEWYLYVERRNTIGKQAALDKAAIHKIAYDNAVHNMAIRNKEDAKMFETEHKLRQRSMARCRVKSENSKMIR
jgi:hypothetical protein